MDQIADRMLQKYERAKQARVNFEPLFEDCFEYALPMRQSFYTENPGQRRDDKIFDETAVVGVQEFASRLQSGLVPNFARWADFVAGSEIPPDKQDAVNNSLDEVTDYVLDASRTTIERCLKKQMIELRAIDVPSLVTGPRVMIGKDERFRFAVVAADKLHSVFFGEPNSVEFINDSQPLKHPISLGH